MRTLMAACLTFAALLALLLSWFTTGWTRLANERAQLLAAPAEAARQRADDLADQLLARLEELRFTEARRPYYHYQALFHDPSSASIAANVAPSPLAAGPDDPLVRGYFQVRAGAEAATVTMPTLNDDVPELTLARTAEADRALRAELAAIAPAVIARVERPGDAIASAVVAQVDLAPEPARVAREFADDKPSGKPVRKASPSKKPSGQPTKASKSFSKEDVLADLGESDSDDAAEATPVSDNKARFETARAKVAETNIENELVLSQSQYAQNSSAPAVYQSARAQQTLGNKTVIAADANEPNQDVTAQAEGPTVVVEPKTATVATPAPPVTRPRPRRRPVPAPAVAAPLRVTVTTSPLEWHRLELARGPALAALRQVMTPDGPITQGWVVAEDELRRWLTDAQPGATLVAANATNTTDPGAAATAQIAGGAWAITVPPLGLATAHAQIGNLRTAFWGRFLPITALALACGTLVVVMVRRSERLAQQRANFAAAAAHELRTPLAGLQLYGDMLADGLGDPSKAPEYARRISEEAARLGRVVSNVLGFSQLERGNLSINVRPGDLTEAVDGLVTSLRPALARADMNVTWTVPDPVMARFDHDALARILGNLLDNAEKYSREAADRDVTCEVRTTPTAAEIWVSDHGPGVSPERARKLFAPFTRGVGNDGPAGLGLGLALSRSLARAMGGELRLEPAAPDRPGAIFVLALPRA